MARFEQTLKNLKAIAALMPVATAAPSAAAPAGNSEGLEKQLLSILVKEDYVAVKIALLCDKLITKYKGRAV